MFDVKDLLAAEGITEQVRRAFVVYLAGHNRPMDELLSPKFKGMEGVYEREFVGIATKPVTYKSLTAARDKCVATLRKALDDREKRFLISFMEQMPEWDILGIPDLEKLPSLQWKSRNIALMATKKRATALAALKKALDA